MIRFKTPEERMLHPQAKLIPQVLWTNFDFFRNEIEESLLQLMQVPTNELLSSLKKIDILNTGVRGIFVALSLSHPDAELEILHSIAMKFKLDKDYLIKLLLIIGNVKWIDSFFHEENTSIHEKELFNWYYFNAAQYGNVTVLEYLESKAPELVHEAIKKNGFAVYLEAISNGCRNVLEHLESRFPNLVQELNELPRIFSAYSQAARYNHRDVLEHLISQFPILASDFDAYGVAIAYGHDKIAHRILFQSSAFLARAEAYGSEYTSNVNLFIEERVTQLRQESRQVPSTSTFDITDSEQAQICFYIMRRLIRSNDVQRLDDLRFLLSIPSVNALAHQSIEGRPNDLLLLAFNNLNIGAASILLTLPEVAILAKKNDYYHKELGYLRPDDRARVQKLFAAIEGNETSATQAAQVGFFASGGRGNLKDAPQADDSSTYSMF